MIAINSFPSLIMFGFLRSFSALVLAAGLAQAASPNPMSCSGVCGNAHDPSILQDTSGTYYRFSTGGGIAIHTSSKLTGPWTYKGQALTSSKIDGNTDLWVCLCDTCTLFVPLVHNSDVNYRLPTLLWSAAPIICTTQPLRLAHKSLPLVLQPHLP